jgi:hypothetical protein
MLPVDEVHVRSFTHHCQARPETFEEAVLVTLFVGKFYSVPCLQAGKTPLI